MAKKKAENLDLEIALATKSHSMFKKLMSRSQRDACYDFKTTEELLEHVKKTDSWKGAAAKLSLPNLDDAAFSTALELEILHDYEALYRFAHDSAKEFLKFVLLRARLRAVVSSVRRILTGKGGTKSATLPPTFSNLDEFKIKAVTEAKTYEQLVQAERGKAYYDTLLSLEPTEETGLPSFADVSLALEHKYSELLYTYVNEKYQGEDRDKLMEVLGFREDMKNAHLIYRLKRFGTSLEKVKKYITPFHRGLNDKMIRALYEAETDAEFIKLVAELVPRYKFPEIVNPDPEWYIDLIQDEYFEKVLHSTQNMATVYSYLYLKESELIGLRKIYVAIEYGIDPRKYV